MTKKEKKIAVLAGNIHEFYYNFGDDDRYIYVDRIEKCFGIEFCKYLTIGTFYKVKDINKLIDEVRIRIR